LYIERFDKGYKGSDERYKMWLQMYHSDSLEVGDQNVNSLGESVFHTPVKGRVPHAIKPTAKAVALAKPSSAIEKFFSCLPPPSNSQH